MSDRIFNSEGVAVEAYDAEGVHKLPPQQLIRRFERALQTALNFKGASAGSPKPCPNCDDGCTAEKWCEGCERWLCMGCWYEHNDNAECHICGEYSKRDEEGNLTEEGCAC